MALNYSEKIDGIPVRITVEQADGTNKLVELFLPTDEKSLLELSKLAKAKQADQKNIQKELEEKYPLLKEDNDDENIEQTEEKILAFSGIVADSYDELFGAGTYKRLSDAGLGVLKLQPLLDDITDGIAEELENMQDEQSKKSANRKAKLLKKRNKGKK